MFPGTLEPSSVVEVLLGTGFSVRTGTNGFEVGIGLGVEVGVVVRIKGVVVVEVVLSQSVISSNQIE